MATENGLRCEGKGWGKNSMEHFASLKVTLRVSLDRGSKCYKIHNHFVTSGVYKIASLYDNCLQFFFYWDLRIYKRKSEATECNFSL
jgi:hypothetical protein